MPISASSHAARAIVAIILLGLNAAAFPAKTTPPSEDERAIPRMVDARVNLKESHVRASQARPGAAEAGLQRAKGDLPAMAAAFAQRSRATPGLEARYSNLTGGPRLLRSRNGTLTGQAPGRSGEEVVRGFLASHGDIYGLSTTDIDDLVVLGDSPGGASGLRMVRVEQQIDGRPVFQSETRFVMDRDGRLLQSAGTLIPRARAVAPAVDTAKLIAAPAALARLLATVGKHADPASIGSSLDAPGRLSLRINDPYLAGPATAREVLFPLGPGFLVPAWSLVVFTSGGADWYAVVDAETGELLWRKNIRHYASAHDARFRVFVQGDGTTPADSPAPQSPSSAVPGAGTQFPGLAPTVVSMHAAMDAIASPNGWIDDCPIGGCTANQTQTLGNNALACLDRTTEDVCDTDPASILDGNGRPTGNPDSSGRNRDFLGTAPRDFQNGFLPPPQGGNPEAGQTASGDGNNGTTAVDSFRRGAVTHLFYLTNWYHDKLFKLGFDEAAGNFQQTNFSGMGLGNDRVLADAQDGSGTDNASFSAPPDGTSGRMQMYLFTGPTIMRDGALDAEVVLHELTHGTTNRLIGNAAGLNWDPGSGMDEGWADFYALSLLNNTNADDPNGRYAAGAYTSYKPLAAPSFVDNYVYGSRRFPYSTNHAVNPLTWADVDDVTNNLSGGIAPDPLGINSAGGMDLHNVGEIWALTLWGVRARIIADPAGANGSVPTGNHTALQLVTDAMKMTPNDPTFTEARDAIIDADCATNACANEASIWAGFADRGLGYGAKTPYNVAVSTTSSSSTHMAIHESFSVPFLDVVNVATDVAINDSAPNNNNGVIDPGETVKITVKLTNPWRAAGKAMTGATATLTTVTPGITIQDGSAVYGAIAPQGTATGDTFMFKVDQSVPCGSAISFTLTTVSNLGNTATSFQLRVGAASGTDPVVTYTGDPNPDLAIPDNNLRGVVHSINVAEDFVIADLNFRINSITHTFAPDLSAMLRSPGGVGVDLVSFIGVGFGSSGENITNMVIDDDLAVSAANDMVQALSTDAPYTRSWLPVFNSPWTTGFGFPASDPIGNLSRYNGTSTKGTWSILVADRAELDTGTLNAWSILVTPVHFACTAVNMAAPPTIAKAFGNPILVQGGTSALTFTVLNPAANSVPLTGIAFSDTFPAGLIVSTPNGLTGSCGGGTITANAGTSVVSLTGATLAPGASCVFSVKVSATTEGVKNNTTGIITSTNGGSGATSNTASLTVSFTTLDLDASINATKYDALTDGLLAIRYLSGATGTALTNGVLGGTATRTDPGAMKTYLDGIRAALDIDGDGEAKPLTDGVLIVRYLFGLRGNALTQGALGTAPTRNTAEIEDYLSKLTP